MACRLTLAQISDYHFGKVAETERAGLEHHLLSCKVCLSDFVDLKRDIELTLEQAVMPTPAVRAQIFQEADGFFKSRRLRRLVSQDLRSKFVFAGMAAAAALVVISLFGTYFFKRPPEDGQNKFLLETIDSGGDSPRHLTTL